MPTAALSAGEEGEGRDGYLYFTMEQWHFFFFLNRALHLFYTL